MVGEQSSIHVFVGTWNSKNLAAVTSDWTTLLDGTNQFAPSLVLATGVASHGGLRPLCWPRGHVEGA
jgi:hypothetical protein